MPQLKVEEANESTAFVTGPDGYDVVNVCRLTADNHGGDENPENTREEIDAMMLTDDQWEAVVQAIHRAVQTVKL